jgi:hypothetical protein
MVKYLTMEIGRNLIIIVFRLSFSLYIILQWPYSIIGQVKNCSDSVRNLCFTKIAAHNTEMKFEKKVESSDDVWTGDNALSVDMDGDCIPELVIPAVREKSILIIDSNSGLTKWRISTPFIEFSPGSIAIAKFDEFSAPVVFLKAGIASSYPPNIRGRLMCYSADGSLKWISDSRYDIQLNNVGGKLALADFNQDGRPEVYLNNCIFNALTGVKLVDGGANGLGMESAYTFPLEALTVAAQFDTNIADLELAAGYTIYKVHIENIYGTLGNYMTAHNIKVDNFYRDGFTTVGDINTDGISDVIVACPGKDNRGLIYAYCLVNGIPELIAKIYSQSVEDYIGPPLVADIVGYDVPSIIVSRSAQLTAYSFNGSKVFKQDWMFVTTDSSGFTGVTAFDFNNDGVREIVFRDETFLRIINGSNSTPFEVAKIRCYSATRNEYPVVGDFDNTGKAKICVPCSLEPDGGFGKLFIIGPPDSLPGWAPARGIWNQYNYHVLNINDDLTVPRIQKSNATYKNGKYNNFLVQESLLDSNGMYKVAAANLWGEIDCIDYDPVAEEYTVTFNVFNHKKASAGVDGALPVSFYNGDPATIGSLLGIYYTKVPLDPGDSLVHQEFKFMASQINDLYMVVNTRRDTSGAFDPKDFSSLECDYADNVFHTTEFPKTQRISASICKGSNYPFYDRLLYEQGLYIHTLNSQKGCDSLIALLELAIVDTVHSLQTLSVCDSFIWDGMVYRENGTFVNHFQTSAGCDSVVTLNLSVRQSSDTLIHETACGKFDFNDKVYTEGGRYFIKIRNRQGCDSTIELNLSIVPLDTNVTKLNNTLTALDSLATYQWVDCDEDYAPVVNATQRSYTPVRSGNYGVILSSPPCSDTTVCIHVIVTHAFNENEHLCLIYPNPATSKLYVQFPGGLTGNVILTIYDIHGRDLYNRALVIGEREFIELDVSGLVEGVYSLRIRSAILSDHFIFSKMGMSK